MKKIMIILISIFLLGGFMINTDISQAVEAHDKELTTMNNKTHTKP